MEKDTEPRYCNTLLIVELICCCRHTRRENTLAVLKNSKGQSPGSGVGLLSSFCWCLQVMASQKQIEVKYKQAQKSAVSYQLLPCLALSSQTLTTSHRI